MLRRLLISVFVLMMTTPLLSQTPTIETGVSQSLARWRAAHYSDVRYKLNLTLEKGAPLMKGTIEISLKNNADQIILDWRKIKGKENLSQISNVFINNKPANFQEINEHLVFKENVVKGENVIKLDFTSPIATSGAAVTRYVDKEDGTEYVYSLFVPSDASTAFPVFDQPDLKARFLLIVDAPSRWKIISNTDHNVPKPILGYDSVSTSEPVISRKVKGNVIIEFKETQPISTYVFAFAAGDFREVNEYLYSNELTKFNQARKVGRIAYMTEGTVAVPMEEMEDGAKIYVRKSQAEKFEKHAAETFRLNREGVKFLESYFDYKFPFPKYDLVLIPEFPFRGMEHAGATFLREDSIIFPQEPTANDKISRANVIFHEAAHQWFGDTVTMKWFDDLWLKEGFAEFMAYKTLEKVMPEYNAWKAFYERNKPLAYLTDSTKGTTPIYQEIPNLSSAKSAYGNIVYRKAPSFLRQAEFYLGEDKFQTAVRAFLKKHEFANAEWTDLVKEFETVSWTTEGYPYFAELSAKKQKALEARDKKLVNDWAEYWVRQKGVPIIGVGLTEAHYEKSLPSSNGSWMSASWMVPALGLTLSEPFENSPWALRIKTLYRYGAETEIQENLVSGNPYTDYLPRLFDKNKNYNRNHLLPDLIFPNYQDYGYGIFLLDEKSRDYVLGNIQNEKDDFLRSMMWGTLWDSVREAELDPKTYVELAIKNISTEKDELTIQTILSRVSTAMNYYLSEKQQTELAPHLENLLLEKMQNAPTLGQRITFYRAFLNVSSSEKAKDILKKILKGEFGIEGFNCMGDACRRPQGLDNADATWQGQAQPLQKAITILKTKDKFDIITKLLILGDTDAPKLLAELEKSETSDEAKRYAYAAKAGIAKAENKQIFFNDFINNKEISESWIESAFVPFNSVKHAELTLPHLEKALAELPNLKRNRKIFFINGWLAAFIGGQKDEKALGTVNKFLADNPNLDKDLRLKILEVADGLERAVKIRNKFK